MGRDGKGRDGKGRQPFLESQILGSRIVVLNTILRGEPLDDKMNCLQERLVRP